MYLNKVVIAGNLTKDPELKALPSGMKVVNFSVATNKVWKDANGAKQEKVTFHNCKAFGKTAETIAQYFTKGKPIYLEGEIDNTTSEVEGAKKYKTEVLVQSFQFNGGDKNESPKQEEKQEKVGGYGVVEYPNDDINPEDIPF